ncbi:jg7977 [Pararge aegeria aegeria]|uniref:Jg7977 protein n=1 Tax=Pararge aegeria aegeria TaxID=348720 RepID=A0A8S4S3Q6_9NEOP|nr:jg7977 [Pararge aegeria aegeria]
MTELPPISRIKNTQTKKMINGIRDIPLCRACMEADETPTHVLLQCRGVAEQPPDSLPEGLGDLGGLLAGMAQRGAVPVAVRKTEGSGRLGDQETSSGK